jgi:hypothetical protein
MSEKDSKSGSASRDSANIKLAVALGLVAFGIYAGYILFHMLD